MLESLVTVNSVFDRVFVINLPNYWERRLKTMHQLRGWGIDFEIFEAIYGYDDKYEQEFETYTKIPPGEIDDNEYKEIELRRNGKMIDSRGAWGYLLTCQKILEKSIQEGYKRILILDDDVLLHCDFEVKFSDFMNSIKSEWKIAKLGASQYGWDSPRMTKIGESFAPYYYPGKVGTCGSFAVGLDYSIYQEVLEELKKMRSSFDNLPLGNIYKKYKGDCFVSFPNVITPDVTQSIIRGGRDQFTQGEIMKWQMEYFPVFDGLPSISILVVLDERNIQSVLEKIHTAFKQNYENITWHVAYPEELMGDVKMLFSYKNVQCFSFGTKGGINELLLNNIQKLPNEYIMVFPDGELPQKDTIRDQLEEYLNMNTTHKSSYIFEKNSFKSYAKKHMSIVNIFRERLKAFDELQKKMLQMERKLQLLQLKND